MNTVSDLNETDLNEDVLRAHAKGDFAALVELYAAAGDRALRAGEIDAGCFFTTQAYVFALQDGHGQAEALRATLMRHGREA